MNIPPVLRLLLLATTITASVGRAQDAGSVLASQRVAVQQYPELGRRGSAMCDTFTVEYERLVAARSPMLRNSRWPELLARQCAERLGLQAGDTAVESLPAPKPPAAVARSASQVAPVDLPKFKVEDVLPEAGESFSAYSNRATAQQKEMEARNAQIARAAAEGRDYMAVYLNYLRLDEERLRAQEQADEAAGRREDAQALAGSLEALRLEIQRANSRR